MFTLSFPLDLTRSFDSREGITLSVRIPCTRCQELTGGGERYLMPALLIFSPLATSLQYTFSHVFILHFGS